ncbi:MAG: peptide chain release factor N(5)-glutamine methyltransferase [bacterium]|nr:peptide chain release factor N(5)-glutamine methyltransferase [bacterium]
MQIAEIITHTAQSLKNKGIEESMLEAETLVAHSLRLDRTSIYLNYDKPLSDYKLKIISRIIRRRLNREPLQYLTKSVNFFGLNFIVEPPVFIPRPETEVLVQTLIELGMGLINQTHTIGETVIFDVGTGCGAIGIASLKFLPHAIVYASDVIDLKLAKKNAERIGVSDRINFLVGDLLTPFKSKRADFIVSNPPYIPTQLIPTLQPEIRFFESRTSIDGGKDGLAFISKLIKTAPLYLKPSGVLLVEISPQQKEKVKYEAVKYFKEVNFINDFFDRTRILLAKCA